jgi:hypothetical protein
VTADWSYLYRKIIAGAKVSFAASILMPSGSGSPEARRVSLAAYPAGQLHLACEALHGRNQTGKHGLGREVNRRV